MTISHANITYETYTTILSNCKAKTLTIYVPANGQTSSINKKQPCNIYFAIFSITITLNMQNPPETFCLLYTIWYDWSST